MGIQVQTGKKTRVGMMLLMLVLGVVLGWFGHTVLVFPPSNHKNIIDKLIITTDSNKLASTYLKSGTSTWTLSLVTNFLKGGTYTYSLWTYSYQEDPEVSVCIWGPGEDGSTYQVELSAFWWGRTYTAKIGSITKTFQNNTVIEVVQS